MSDRNITEPRTPSETEIAQTTPKGVVRSYDEMNTGQMVFELQGTVGELKESIAALTRTVEKGFSRIDGVERTGTEIKEALRLLVPKLEDLAGFTKHRAPTLADKADLANLKTTITQDVLNIQSKLQTEIEKRPTRVHTVLVKFDVDSDGDKVLDITVVLEEGPERLDREKLVGFVRHLRSKLVGAHRDEFPLLSFVSKTEAKKLLKLKAV